MQNREIYWNFFRPTLIVILGFAGFGVCWWITHPADAVSVDQVATRLNLRAPDPSLSPEEVVRIQLSALCNRRELNGIVECFRFASPKNRAATGPIERFASMVTSPPYAIIAKADSVLVGAATGTADQKRVLVNVTADDEIQAFFLGSQFATRWTFRGLLDDGSGGCGAERQNCRRNLTQSHLNCRFRRIYL